MRRLNGAHLDVTKQVQRDLQLSKRRENGLSEKTHRHQSSSHMPRTLYQTILGPEFDKVPVEIRRKFHSVLCLCRCALLRERSGASVLSTDGTVSALR
jgi:hypothetical protein